MSSKSFHKQVKETFMYSAITKEYSVSLTPFSDLKLASRWYRGSFVPMSNSLPSHIRECFHHKTVSVSNVVDDVINKLVRECFKVMEMDSNYEILMTDEGKLTDDHLVKLTGESDRRKTLSSINYTDSKSESKTNIANLLRTPVRVSISSSSAASSSSSMQTGLDQNDPKYHLMLEFKRNIVENYHSHFTDKITRDLQTLFTVIMNSIKNLSVNSPGDVYNKSLNIQDRTNDVSELWFLICKECFLPHQMLKPSTAAFLFYPSSVLHARRDLVRTMYKKQKLEVGESLMDFALRLQWFKHAFDQVNENFDDGSILDRFYDSIKHDSRYLFAYEKAEIQLINFYTTDILQIVDHMEKTLLAHNRGQPYTSIHTRPDSALAIFNNRSNRNQNRQHHPSSPQQIQPSPNVSPNPSNKNSASANNNNRHQQQHSVQAPRLCYACGGEGHIRSACRFKDSTCSHCNFRGHIAKACRKKQQDQQSSSSMSNTRPHQRQQQRSQRTHLAQEDNDSDNENNDNDINESNDNDNIDESNNNIYQENDNTQQIEYTGAVFLENDGIFSMMMKTNFDLNSDDENIIDHTDDNNINSFDAVAHKNKNNINNNHYNNRPPAVVPQDVSSFALQDLSSFIYNPFNSHSVSIDNYINANTFQSVNEITSTESKVDHCHIILNGSSDLPCIAKSLVSLRKQIHNSNVNSIIFKQGHYLSYFRSYWKHILFHNTLFDYSFVASNHKPQRLNRPMPSPTTIILDSGSGSHLHASSKPLPGEVNVFPLTLQGIIKSAPSVTLSLAGNRHYGSSSFVEHNVYRSTDIAQSLSSVSKHTDDGYIDVFTQRYAYVVKPKVGKTIHDLIALLLSISDIQVIFRRRGNFYVYNEEESVTDQSLLSLSSRSTMKDLHIIYRAHCTLGHINYYTLRSLANLKNDDLKSIQFEWTPEEVQVHFPCSVCSITKLRASHKQPISSRPAPIHPLQYLFFDLSGKFNYDFSSDSQIINQLHQYFHSWRYFDVCVDGYSKMVFIKFLSRKSEASSWRINLINHQERQCDSHVKKIFMDKGGENIVKSFVEYCNMKGIDIVLAPTGHKERQGQVERYMPTLWSNASAMLMHSNLHVVFMPFAMNYFVYIFTRIPVKGSNVPRLEKHYNIQARYRGLYTFGSDAFVKQLQSLNKTDIKESGKAIPAIFLGFSDKSEHTHVFLAFRIDEDNKIIFKLEETNDFQIIDNRFKHLRDVLGHSNKYSNVGIFSDSSTEISSDLYFDFIPDSNPISASSSRAVTSSAPTVSEVLNDDAPSDSDSESTDDNNNNNLQPQNTESDIAPGHVIQNHYDNNNISSVPISSSSLQFDNDTEPRRSKRVRQPVDHGAVIDHTQLSEEAKIQVFPDLASRPAAHIHHPTKITKLSEAPNVAMSLMAFDIIDFTNIVKGELALMVKESTTTPELATLVKEGPRTYKEYQQLSQIEKQLWDAVILKEYNALIEKGTFDGEPIYDIKKLPIDAIVITTRYVLVEKIDDKNNHTKKARLVARDFKIKHKWSQLMINFNNNTTNGDTHLYAPVMNTKSLRLIFILAVLLRLRLYQIDINNAFLNADYKRNNVYVVLPEGFFPQLTIRKLKKPLYGMRDAPKEWYDCFTSYLKDRGFIILHHSDECCLIKWFNNNQYIIIGIHVDDTVCAVTQSHEVLSWWNQFLKDLDNKWGIKNLGVPKFCLGINIDVHDDRIYLHQTSYIKKALERFDIQINPTIIPEHSSNPNLRVLYQSLSEEQKLNEQNQMKQFQYNLNLYQQYLGTLLFASIMTRPDISHSVQLLSRDLGSPLTVAHFEACQYIFRYLLGTTDYGLCYKNHDHNNHNHNNIEINIEAYSDADYAGDKANSKSTTGYIILINNNIAHWQSKQQTSVSVSTCQSEYLAMASAVKDIIWYQQLLEQMKFKVNTPILYVDNQSAITSVTSISNNHKLRQVRISHHFIKDEVESGRLIVKKIDGTINLADVFTKTLMKNKFIPLRDRLVQSTKQLLELSRGELPIQL